MSMIDAACARSAWKAIMAVTVGAPGLRRNTITGGLFVLGEDDLLEEVMKAIPRIRAVVHFGWSGPSGQRLPINHIERKVLECSTEPTDVLWSLFAGSLEASDFDYRRHPSFIEYAAGVFAAHHNRRLLEKDPSLASEYPPKPLAGLDHRSTAWRPVSGSGRL
ncbi:hypothetical protein NKK52_25915 [Mesorhizobium sp. C277A]|uniref:hypothetical protein n=1 Tax=Mesorhizobium sp. C277A TaxID=2956827 RepID=UPI0003CEF40D|nr:hypothetical protein [Mesorhizobium sp. LSJC277A00]ESW73489.1 hypothetical protein X771_02240 [Mesorhizobium sp. LSJC277A00]